MSPTTRALMIVALAAGMHHAARADTTSPSWHVSLECDPAPFLLNGYGCVASVRPSATRLKIGIASYALTYPDFLIFDSNAGFHVEIRPSFNLLAAYRLGTRPRGGWFAGASVRQARTTYSLDGTEATTRSTAYEIGPIGGYIWYPTRSGLYFQFWGSLSRDVYETRSPTVDSRTFDKLPLTPYLAVHVGFEI